MVQNVTNGVKMPFTFIKVVILRILELLNDFTEEVISQFGMLWKYYLNNKSIIRRQGTVSKVSVVYYLNNFSFIFVQFS